MVSTVMEGRAANSDKAYSYSVTGSAAHARLVPLLPANWKDCTTEPETVPDFVWENAPRKITKAYRDQLKAYSHLPNGTAILDSKWVLARLFEGGQNKGEEDPYFAVLESHCFRGPEGYESFCQKVFSTSEAEPSTDTSSTSTSTSPAFPDLLTNNGLCPASLPKEPSSLWVIKDAFSNGAGGIWVIDSASREVLQSDTKSNQGPLYVDHRYVAQRYAWPPVLYGRRKCHVRVYGLLTADGRAFVHQRAFLHLSNDDFFYDDNPGDDKSDKLQDSVHITNCCANSHDDSKFAGEILADLEAVEFSNDEGTGQTIVPLGPFFPSIKASLAALAQRAGPFLSGGQGNNGFEYLGMDFILSYRENASNDLQHQPVAYLLEVNAPPSQDTATGLKHAEDLHNEVIRDILTLWVIPKVTDGAVAEAPGKWRCAFTPPPKDEKEDNSDTCSELILPSKAAIINKIRWGMLERKTMKVVQDNASHHVPTARIRHAAERSCDDGQRYVTTTSQENYPSTRTDPIVDLVLKFARTKCFPFFQQQRTDSIACGNDGAAPGCCNSIAEKHSSSSSHAKSMIFWESAGGSQVPIHVIERMTASLRHRHRAVIGAADKQSAREALGTILGAKANDYSIFLGENATALLGKLANQYVQLGLIRQGDEIVISSENHVANVNPWLLAAQQVGAKVKWWGPTRLSCPADNYDSWSTELHALLTNRTRIVAVPHASNILGQIRDLSSMRKLIDGKTNGYAHFVVDGVAAAPHWHPAVSEHQIDWYVVSCHKLFGPHLGALCGRRQTGVSQLCIAADIAQDRKDGTYKLLEFGTINYEACAGLVGLRDYFGDLARLSLEGEGTLSAPSSQTPFQSPQEELSHRDQLSITKPEDSKPIRPDMALKAYQRIRMVEESLVNLLLAGLSNCTKVRIAEIDNDRLSCLARLPVVSFRHETISSRKIVEVCCDRGIVCRHGTFLSCSLLQKDLNFDDSDGLVRFSLVHYNTANEIDYVVKVLEGISGWF